MKRLRPFVTFDHDLRKNLANTLSRSEKAEITRYYNKLSAAITDKHVVYRPRKSENIAKAEKASGQRGAKFKAYAINSPTGAGKVKWKGDNVVIEKEGAFVRTIYPDQRRLAVEPGPYLDALLDDKKTYIINSKNDWRVGGVKAEVINALQSAMWRYGWAENVYNDFWDDEEVEGEGEYGENEKEEFTITIIEVDTRNRKTFQQYKKDRYEATLEGREIARKKAVRERSAARRKRAGKRPYGRAGRNK